MIELDAVPVGFVGCRQWQPHRRILFVAEVEENHVISDLAGAKGQKVLRGELADQWIGLQAVFESHGESVTPKRGATRRICDLTASGPELGGLTSASAPRARPYHGTRTDL